MATVIVTGGGGFLGQCLASEIVERGSIESETDGPVPVVHIILADVRFPDRLQPKLESSSSLITKATGSIADASFCSELFSNIPSHARQHVSVFHLGGVMSGDGERDFDLCLSVNLFGTINILQAARSYGTTAKFIFASSAFTVGSGADTDYVTSQDTISDAARATPHTTYGATKACCELLLSDFSRRGFVDARGVRLPTILVRAGAPNAATTSVFSGVVREPLARIDVVSPIARDVLHAVTSKRAAINAMLALHDVKKGAIDATLGFDRTVFIPAVAVSLGDLQDALFRVVSPSSHSKLGKITYEVDQVLSDIVGSFPTQIDASRATKLGIPSAPTAETLVREYIADFSSAIAPGIKVVPEEKNP